MLGSASSVYTASFDFHFMLFKGRVTHCFFSKYLFSTCNVQVAAQGSDIWVGASQPHAPDARPVLSAVLSPEELTCPGTNPKQVSRGNNLQRHEGCEERKMRWRQQEGWGGGGRNPLRQVGSEGPSKHREPPPDRQTDVSGGIYCSRRDLHCKSLRQEGLAHWGSRKRANRLPRGD